MKGFFKRSLEPILQKSAATFPAVLLTGPRQSGKTTLLKKLFPNHTYITLESPDIRLQIKTDVRGFFSDNSKHWIIDEAQNDPNLFSYIQEWIDQKPTPGRFILSGSQNFALAQKVSQSLAGRVAILELLPLSYEEYLTHPEQAEQDIWSYLYHGSYPRPYQENLDTTIWYNGYIRTYLERDVRELLNIRDLSQFQMFLKLCAGRHGQLLNMSAIGNECGLSQTTINHWISILEASYLVYRLQPYHRNFNKRLVKTPKLYFYDSALVCQLLGIESPEHLKIHAARGAIFEGFIISELKKRYFSLGKNPPIYFWRDHLGIEIDAVIETSSAEIGIEIKSSTTYTSDFLSNLQKWKKFSDTPSSSNFLIYTGEQSIRQNNIDILPWTQLAKIF